WRGARRRTFVLAWLSVYLYVGATVLVPFAIVHLLVVRWLDGRWDRGPLIATLAGPGAGGVGHPCLPRPRGSVGARAGPGFERGPALIPGEYRGAEWAILGTDMLVRLAGATLLAWAVVLVRQLGRAARVSTAATSAAIAALGTLGAGLVSGSKLVELFVVFS